MPQICRTGSLTLEDLWFLVVTLVGMSRSAYSVYSHINIKQRRQTKGVVSQNASSGSWSCLCQRVAPVGAYPHQCFPVFPGRVQASPRTTFCNREHLLHKVSSESQGDRKVLVDYEDVTAQTLFIQKSIGPCQAAIRAPRASYRIQSARDVQVVTP